MTQCYDNDNIRLAEVVAAAPAALFLRFLSMESDSM